MFSVTVRREGLELSSRFPWRVGIVAFMANPSVLKGREAEETVRVLAEDPFFDLIEINELPDDVWKKVSKIIKEYNVDVAVGLQPLVLMEGYNPSSLDEGERRRAVERIKESIDRASERGVTTVAFCSGSDPGKDKREEGIEALIKSLKEIVGHAEDRGVFVLLETFDRDWDKRQLIGPIGDAVKVAREVREEYKNFGLMWDLSHAPMLGEKPSDLKRASEFISHIHIGCAKRVDKEYKDWHPGFYRPGSVNGVEEVADLIKALVEIGYKGAVSFEVKPEEGQGWREVVEAAKGVLYTAYARYLGELL